MALWPFIFVKGEAKDVVLRHERIHLRQQVELPLVFLLLYGLFWLCKFIVTLDTDEAYYGNPFEKEAYGNQYNENYLKERRWFAWVRYF